MFQLMHAHAAAISIAILAGYATGATAGFLVFYFGVFGDIRRQVLAKKRSDRARALRWPEPAIHSAKTLAPPKGSSLYAKDTVNVSLPASRS